MAHAMLRVISILGRVSSAASVVGWRCRSAVVRVDHVLGAVAGAVPIQPAARAATVQRRANAGGRAARRGGAGHVLRGMLLLVPVVVLRRPMQSFSVGRSSRLLLIALLLR